MKNLLYLCSRKGVNGFAVGVGCYWTGDFNREDKSAKAVYFISVDKMDMVDASWSMGYSIRPVRDAWAEGIEDVQNDNVQSTKVLRDGQLFIERNGRTYDAKGVEVR